MEETIKNRIILILAVLALILFMATISSCSNAYREKSARDKEMAARLDLEEKMSSFSQEKTILEEKLSAKEKELAEEEAAHQMAENALAQEKLINQSLQEELVKITKLKETLEEDLKEALVAGKSARPRR